MKLHIKHQSKEEKLSRLSLIGKHIEKYRIMMSIMLTVFILSIVALIIYWEFDENSISPAIDLTYLISQSTIALLSLGMILTLLFNKKGKIYTVKLAGLFNIYSAILMIWSAAMGIIDLKIGTNPIIYLLVATIVSSFFLIEPFFFVFISSISFISIFTCVLIYRYDFFYSQYGVENTIMFIIFSIIIVAIAFRHFNVAKREYDALKRVQEMSYIDDLTSLKNEKAYYEETELINEKIKKNVIEPFGVILCDVNNLKATNDKYGHRFGCSLVIRTGHTLKRIFKTSDLYHVGGDEFIVIVKNEDLTNFEEVIQDFDKKLRYRFVDFEGVELLFSCARGYSFYQEGDLYKDVLQRADEMMYQNKAEIKKTYKIESR